MGERSPGSLTLETLCTSLDSLLYTYTEELQQLDLAFDLDNLVLTTKHWDLDELKCASSMSGTDEGKIKYVGTVLKDLLIEAGMVITGLKDVLNRIHPGENASSNQHNNVRSKLDQLADICSRLTEIHDVVSDLRDSEEDPQLGHFGLLNDFGKSIYTPLADRHIRLLDILPQQSDMKNWDVEPVRCQFVIASLDKFPRFNIVSHTWASSDDSSHIQIFGVTFPISGHLLTGLQRLRNGSDSAARTLVWIDRLCVDQSSDSERSQCLLMLPKIYSLAMGTLVWLGECPDLPRRVGGEDLRDRLRIDMKRPETGLKWITHLQKCILKQSLHDWSRRIWSVAEFALSEKLLFCLGPHTITLTTSGTGSISGRNLAVMSETFDQFNNVVRAAGSSVRLSLYRALRNTAGFDFSLDPRDHIYSVSLMLNQPGGQHKIEIDYSKSVSEVYADAALAIINEEETVDVLLEQQDRNRAGIRSADTWDHVLPSWVPLFKHTIDPEALRARRDTMLETQATTDIPKVFIRDLGEGARLALQMRGIDFDFIQVAYDLESFAFEAGHIRELMSSRLMSRPIVNLPFDIGFRPQTSDVMRAVLLEALNGQMDDLAETATKRQIIGAPSIQPRSFSAKSTTASDPTPSARRDDVEEEDVRMTRALQNSFLANISSPTLQKRQIFVTTRGFWGIGFPSMKAWDTLMIPFGGSRPFVFRSCGRGLWKLVGDAVIPAVSSGEIQRAHLRGELDAGDVVII